MCVCGKIYIKFAIFNHFKVNPVVLIAFTLLPLNGSGNLQRASNPRRWELTALPPSLPPPPLPRSLFPGAQRHLGWGGGLRFILTNSDLDGGGGGGSKRWGGC